MHQPGAGQIFSIAGNFGLTLLAVAPAIIGLLMPFSLKVSVPIITILLLLLYFDIQMFMQIGKMREAGLKTRDALEADISSSTT